MAKSKPKYSLVRYVDDGIYQVCASKRIVKRNNKVYAKWLDGNSYLAKIIATSSFKCILQNVGYNMEKGLPKIIIRNEKFTGNITQGNMEQIIDNEGADISITTGSGISEDNNNNNHINLKSSAPRICNLCDEYVSDLNFHLLKDHNLMSSTRKPKCLKNPFNEKEIGNEHLDQDLDLCMFCGDFVEDIFRHVNESHSNENIAFYLDSDYDPNENVTTSYIPTGIGAMLSAAADDSIVVQSEMNNNHMSNLESYNSFNNEPPNFKAGDQMVINDVEFSNSRKKRYFCIYCKQKCLHFPRHLEKIHKEEKDVKLFMSLPKGTQERKSIIDLIRKRGNFFYNCDYDHNQGDLLVTRRPIQGKSKTSENFLPCPNCYGFYNKTSLTRHYKKCSSKLHEDHHKSVIVMGKRIRVGISEKANDIVKKYIFPILREDNITKPLKYDELTIVYANKMTTKYRRQHHYPMIRTKIRLIGRILYEIKKLDSSVADFASLFSPRQYDNVIGAINIVANLDIQGKKYKSPSTAASCGTLLKKCGNIYITELIKKQDKHRKKEVEDFLKLIEVDYCTSVNKTVSENQLENKRNKKIILPNISDIQILNQYLKLNRQKYYKLVLEDFSTYNYKKLASYTLTSVQVFNRRRAGEIERIEIRDFKNYQSIDKNTNNDIINSLSAEELKAAGSYVRFGIRGKLGREVPVLLSKELTLCIELLIKSREKAGVFKTNPYVFGIPSSEDEPKYLRACNLLKEFSVLCGAKNPASLRGTNLRKHIATHSVIYNLTDTEVSDLANFMGHHERIHKDHYRIPIAARDITRMSRLLRMAQGEDGYEVDSEDESDQEVEELTVEHENADSNNSVCLNISEITRKRSTSPMGHVTRRTWTSEEISVVNQLFHDNIIKAKLPSLEDCQNAIIENTALHSRTPTQLKVWIYNQVKKEKCSSSSLNIPVEKIPKIKRTTWNSPEKSVACQVFDENIRKKKLPSIQMCRDIIKKHDILRNRTAVQLKLWVSNQIKKM